MLVSVIIPCYNSSHSIERCLQSVFNQTYTQLEIICVNDGSKDNTLEKLVTLKQKSKLAFTIIDQPNKGACAARNAGVSVAKGSYIQFLDADDELLEDKIAHQLELVDVAKPDLIIGSLTVVHIDGRTEEVKPDSADNWSALVKGRAGCTCSNLFSKDILHLVGGWNENFKSSQETELMFRILQNSDKVEFDMQSNTTIHKQAAGSISNMSITENWLRYINLRLSIWQYLKSKGLLTKKNSEDLRTNLFNTLRILYVYDSEKAVQLYNQHMKNDLRPVYSKSVSKIYWVLFRLLGFSLAERLYQRIRN